MEQKTIALEESLSRFRQPLEEAGFATMEITRFAQTDSNRADLVMISGQYENLMGIQTTSTSAPVINVGGLTAEEIVSLARDRLC